MDALPAEKRNGWGTVNPWTGLRTGGSSASCGTATCGRCRADGKELFFHAPDHSIMAVDITPGSTLGARVPRALFRLPADVNNGRFVVSPEGRRFLVPIEVEKPKPGKMMVILNWTRAAGKSGSNANKDP